MTEKVGRNQPCPCGSGKKYKKCCLPREEKRAFESPPRVPSSIEEPADRGSVAHALSWLAERYPAESIEGLEQNYYRVLTEDERQAIEELPDDLYEMQRINAFEWLLAEGTIQVDDPDQGPERIRVVDLVLFENEDLLDPEPREYLKMLGASPLALYAVVDVEPGEGLWLEDVFAVDKERIEFFVRERSGSRGLHRGDAIGARVLPGDPPFLSGALYPFSPDRSLRLRQDILTGPGGGRRRKIDPGRVTQAIIAHWLKWLVPQFPTLVDAATGASILLTTVHYRVRDWARVQAALEADPSVDCSEEGQWALLEPAPAGEPQRVLWTVTRHMKKNEDRIQVFARTTGRADEAERWLSEHVGNAVERIGRELTDPTHALKRGASRPKETEPPPSPLDQMSPEEAAELAQKLHEHIYRNWHNEPIPALGNKTPRQAIRSKSGRSDVIELLKSYEAQDERRAKAERRPPIDYAFLWARLGLSRQKELG